jgi:hypothetical protein
LFLGHIIAFATAAVAVGQLCVVVITSRAARRVARLAQDCRTGIEADFGHLNSIGRDASRAAALGPPRSNGRPVVRRHLDARRGRYEQRAGLYRTTGARGQGRARGIPRRFQAILEMRRNRARPRPDDEDALFI